MQARPLVQFVLFPLLFVSGAVSLARQEPEPVRLGSGDHVYEWVSGWGALPNGEALGNTHGCIVVDSKDRVYVNTDTARAVLVYDTDGNLLDSWGEELAGGLHGMCLAEVDGQEVLYLAHIGKHAVYKATLDGEILQTIGWPEEAGIYKDENGYRPTSVVVGPSGDLFVADGYGTSWIHRFSSAGEYLESFGGRGRGKGMLQTPHGMWLDQRGGEAELLVADRENHRLQSFALDGAARRIVTGMLRRPCNMQPAWDGSGDVIVADLAGRVTILNKDNELVCHLGDNPDPGKRARNDVPREQCKEGEFVSPHGAAWDSQGNLYVMDWLAFGRVSKLKRVRD